MSVKNIKVIMTSEKKQPRPSVKCPCCGMMFATQKKAERHIRDAQRKAQRLASGKTIVRKPGQAKLDPKTLMPLHESNSKERRIKQGKTRWKTWELS